MNDLSTDETIRAAFTELRAAQLPRSSPPGVAAAHRTLRRRRRVAAGAAGGMTAVLLVGAGYLASAGVLGTGAATDPAASLGATGPAAASEHPIEWQTDLAMEGLELGPDDHTEALWAWGGFDTWEDIYGWDPDWEIPTSRLDVPESGELQLRVACGGTGSVAVTLRNGEDVATDTAQCATTAEEVAAGRAEVTLTVEAGSRPEFQAEPDEAALTGDAAVWVISLPRGVWLAPDGPAGE